MSFGGTSAFEGGHSTPVGRREGTESDSNRQPP
jgi:hypothetical protein